MRVITLLVFGSGVAVLFAACSAPHASKSKFITSFSAADAVGKGYGDPGSQKQHSVSVGGGSTVLGARGIYHRYDSADISIDTSDEPQFLLRIKTEIEQQIQNAGGKVSGGGSSGSSYSIEYEEGNVSGWVDAWGMRGSGDNYKLAIIITEK